MRICLVCREYPPDTVGGGIGTYTANLARGLAQAGHAVSVVAQAGSGAARITREGSVRIHRIHAAWMPGLSPLLRRFGDQKTFADAYLHSRAVAATVCRIADQEGLDIVQSPEHGAEGLALLLRRHRHPVPHVVRFHTPLFMVNQAVGNRLSPGARLVHVMERTAARRAVLNTCASRALAEVVASRFDIPRERIRVVPNAIDHETFHPGPPRTSQSPPTVLYAGKIAPLKGMRALADAIPMIVGQVPGVRLVLIGSDHPGAEASSTRAEMLASLRRAGVDSSVTWQSPVERPRLVALYQEADVFVLPTLWDNFPNACLEAMACGVPVVASTAGGLPEIIDTGRDGVLVPPGDAARLADAVVHLLRAPERRVEMGHAARKKILTTYTMPRVVAATVAVYDEAIARAPAR